MPKKTRKEKILAEYRKKLKLLEKKPLIENKPKEVLSKKTENIKAVVDTSKEDKLTADYFYKDFKRSLFFITLIIVLEVLLYFVRI